jgi:transcriptional regulator with XRE-family HTH domain
MPPPRSIDAHLGEAVRRLREQRQFSLRTLAERTGFSASFMSQVENGQASPSISSMERIASALGVTLAEFFQAAQGTPPAVVRRDSRPALSSEWSQAQLEALGTAGAGARLLPVLVTLQPGGASGRGAHPVGHEEFALVIAGSVMLTLGEVEHTLAEGDAVTIPAGTPRRWHNGATEPTRVLMVAVRVPI